MSTLNSLFEQSQGSDWETLGPVLPHHKVRGSRTADFVRFAQLQSELKVACQMIGVQALGCGMK